MIDHPEPAACSGFFFACLPRSGFSAYALTEFGFLIRRNEYVSLSTAFAVDFSFAHVSQNLLCLHKRHSFRDNLFRGYDYPMDIDYLAVQAKRFMRQLPAFVNLHPDGNACFSECQDFLANLYGFDNASDFQRANHPGLRVRFYEDKAADFRKQGEACYKEDPMQTFAVFEHKDSEAITELHESLYTFYEQNDDTPNWISKSPSSKVNNDYLFYFASELLEKQPWFISAHSAKVFSSFNANNAQRGIEAGQPILDAMFNLLPNDFAGRVSYFDQYNKDFHTLAYATVCCYIKEGSCSSAQEAYKIINRMLKLWPNDNLGFGFLRAEVASITRKAKCFAK